MIELDCFTPGSKALPPTGTGALDGVRLAVKDMIALGGHTSSFGHPRWRETHERAASDAGIIRRLRGAGGQVVGTTKMDQLAYSLIGNVGEGAPPFNSFDAGSFCGGSSSGSASAVAGGLADLGVGTDTAGSIRVPAAACGLFGVRPTHGLINTTGVVPLAPSFDVVGLLARDPGLLRRGLEVVAPLRSAGPTSSRILFPEDIWATRDPRDSAAAQAISRRIGNELDVEVIDVQMGPLIDRAAGDLLARLQSREIWGQHADWVTRNLDALADDVQSRLRMCASLAADALVAIEFDRDAHERYVRDLSRSIPPGSVAIVPVQPRRGPRLAWSQSKLLDFRRDVFQLAAPSTLGGFPQVIIPIIRDSRYTPLGLIGAPKSDDELIGIATTLSIDSGFASRPTLQAPVTT